MKVELELRIIKKQTLNIRSKGTTCYGMDFNQDTCQALNKENRYGNYCSLFDKPIPHEFRFVGSSALIKKLPECIEFCKTKQKKLIREREDIS